MSGYRLVGLNSNLEHLKALELEVIVKKGGFLMNLMNLCLIVLNQKSPGISTRGLIMGCSCLLVEFKIFVNSQIWKNDTN